MRFTTQADLTTHYGAEGWQFFAFVFAAVLTLVFALVDECLQHPSVGRAALKVGAFVVLAYGTLFSPTGKDCLSKFLRVVTSKQ
jgi:hypothetical protein